ncbi:MAG: YifB family Mg chelatase-like AAA ATPase [Lachnospiraceae bacterium]|nr:YifB family Mg chelatase-like AAA ATPase [Lachnospiraceae bacterium]
MYTYVYSGMMQGMYARMLRVEVDASFGLPSFDMVGNMAFEVKEARERVRVAVKNIGKQLPNLRITVNVSPAHLKKAGTGLDLPIAIGALYASGEIRAQGLEETLFLGELGLNGELRGIQGVLPIVNEAKRQGFARVVLPSANAKEGAFVQGIEVYGMDNLTDVLELLSGEKKEPYVLDTAAYFQEKAASDTADFSEVQGQYQARRAAQIAAAGFHHFLLIGPPGAGKTMIARRLPSILPPLSAEESMEISSIYSVAGKLDESTPFITRRPFLNPHHTMSVQAMAGGGRIPRPGVISLAHRAVLFLDELPEFRRDVLEVLRQPMEEKRVQIARSEAIYSFPADFMLVAAMNPCPCGYYPDRNRCKCTDAEITRYTSKISGPILDRIDLCCQVSAVRIEELREVKPSESSAVMRGRVLKARERQQVRFQGTQICFNSQIPAMDIARYCAMTKEAELCAGLLFERLQLSARAYHRLLKVARTIADLEDSELIQEAHLKEAACYRLQR